MKTAWKALAVATVVAVTVAVGAVPALAASPRNDTEAGAVVVNAVPFTHTVDTSEATRDGPTICSRRASVFYRFTPTEDLHVQVDLLGSDFDTALGIYTRDAAGKVERVGCNHYRFGGTAGLRVRAVAGTTYFLMASSDYGSGGNLVLTVTEVSDQALEYTVEVTSQGTVDPSTGIATISGTVTCNERSFVYEEGTLRQLRNGIFVARGGWYAYTWCIPETPTPWTIEIDTDTSVVFGSGPATVRSWYSEATDGWRDWASNDDASTTVQLT